jgi:hypothetical protein
MLYLLFYIINFRKRNTSELKTHTWKPIRTQNSHMETLSFISSNNLGFLCRLLKLFKRLQTYFIGVISRSLESARLVLSFEDLDHPIYYSMHLSSRISSSKHYFMRHSHIQPEIPNFLVAVLPLSGLPPCMRCDML